MPHYQMQTKMCTICCKKHSKGATLDAQKFRCNSLVTAYVSRNYANCLTKTKNAFQNFLKNKVIWQAQCCQRVIAQPAEALKLIAKHRNGMAPNTSDGQKLLKKRPIIETMIGKFKNLFGEKFSRFRSPQSAYFAICVSIITVDFFASF